MFKVGDKVKIVSFDNKYCNRSGIIKSILEHPLDRERDLFNIEIDVLSAVTTVTFRDILLDDSKKEEKETVAKPERYNSGTIEVWDAINGLGFDFMQGAVVKYIARYKKKNGTDDLKKAVNFLVKMIANNEGQDYYELRKKTIDELTEK